MTLFPLFADLQGRRTLVVGGGAVASRKAQSLLQAGALVTVGAPELDPALARLAAGTPFLTAVDQEFPEPARISGDHALRQAARDTAFRQVIYEERLSTVAGIPAWLLTTGGGPALAVAAAAALAVRRAGRPRRAPGPDPSSGSDPVPGPDPIPGPDPVPGPPDG